MTTTIRSLASIVLVENVSTGHRYAEVWGPSDPASHPQVQAGLLVTVAYRAHGTTFAEAKSFCVKYAEHLANMQLPAWVWIAQQLHRLDCEACHRISFSAPRGTTCTKHAAPWPFARIPVRAFADLPDLPEEQDWSPHHPEDGGD